VLISDGGDAVLSDFGLSDIRADVTSRTVTTHTDISNDTFKGSLYWMSPELLNGSRLRSSSDIYAFGMTIFEVGLISPVRFK
jgi:serine/threonine protein kinase